MKLDIVPPDRLKIVTLSDGEMAIAHRTAKRRDGEKKGYSSTRNWNKGDSFNTHWDGVRGEMAVSQFFDIEWNETNHKTRGSKWDVRARCGLTGEVKTRAKNGYLYAMNNCDPRMQCDFGVLCYLLKEDTVALAGAISKKVWKEHREVVDLGHGERFAIKPSLMRPIDSLAELLDQRRGPY